MDHARFGSLHLAYVLSEDTRRRLAMWDAFLARAESTELGPLQLEIYRHLRSATVGASTRIEGNPLTVSEVAAVIQGEHVDASRNARLEVENYNQALTLAASLSLAPDFRWSHMVFMSMNGQILRALPEDRQGRYRDGPVYIGEAYTGLPASLVVGLMDRLIEWLSESDDHPLVRSALLHLNVLAIHPWFDGNGRTSRVLSTLELLRAGVRNPDLISIEPYLASHRSAYISRLQDAHGPTYAPDQHSATEWVEYIVRVSTDRLDVEVRIREALERDLGVLTARLHDVGHPLDWAPVLWLASSIPIRTRELAAGLGRSMPWARARLSAMAASGWLTQVGRTRGTSYVAGDRLRTLDLQLPDLLMRFEQGQRLDDRADDDSVSSTQAARPSRRLDPSRRSPGEGRSRANRMTAKRGRRPDAPG